MYFVLFLQLMTCLFKKREESAEALLEMLRFCDEWPFERIIRVLARGATMAGKEKCVGFCVQVTFCSALTFFFLPCA